MSFLVFWNEVVFWKSLWFLSSSDICSSIGLSLKTWSHLDKSCRHGVREREAGGLSALPSQIPALDPLIFNPYSFHQNYPAAQHEEKTELSSGCGNIVARSGGGSDTATDGLYQYLGGAGRKRQWVFSNIIISKNMSHISSTYLPTRRSVIGSSLSYTWQSVGMAFFPGKTSPAVSSASWFWSWNLTF